MIKSFPFLRMVRVPKPITCALLFVTLILTGCASVRILTSIPSSVLASLPSPVATSSAEYRAYGDSITAGAVSYTHLDVYKRQLLS